MKSKTPLKTKIKISNASMLIAIAMLAVMFTAGAGIYDRFGQISTVMNLFNDNAYLIVVAVGMTFVLLTGGIDISVASTLAFTGVFSAFLQDKARRRLRLRAVTAARSAGRFQGFFRPGEGFSELFGNFRRVSYQASLWDRKTISGAWFARNSAVSRGWRDVCSAIMDVSRALLAEQGG